jgi:hypothetical protein
MVFKSQIQWPQREKNFKVMARFKEVCNLPSIHGAIDCTYFHIQKVVDAHATCYVFYKCKYHNMQLQVVVDHQRRFRGMFVGMPSSMNDARIMQLSSLYPKATHHGLFHLDHGFQNGIYPYIIGDKGYPLLP